MQAIKKYWWQYENFFDKEMLKHKYIHSIVPQNKFNTNIFGFDIVWCSVIEGNMVLHQKYASSILQPLSPLC